MAYSTATGAIAQLCGQLSQIEVQQVRAREREDQRYSRGSDNPIEMEEHIMFSLLPMPGNGRLLDVGCGVGTVSLELQKRGFDVYGVDFSPVAVERAREKGINAVLCDVDAEGLPFGNDYFGVVWAGDILEHVFDPIFLLKEIARVLSVEGKVLISTPNDMNVYKRISAFALGKSPQSDIYRAFGQCKHHTVMSAELLEYMLTTAGLARYSISAVVKLPRLDKRYSTSKVLSSLFGRTLIAEAFK